MNIPTKDSRESEDVEDILRILRDDMYDGSWDKMVEDLESRLEKRPYLFTISNRIEEDLETIHRLRLEEV